MYKFKEVIERRHRWKYKCDMCREVFLIDNLVLTDPIDAIKMVTLPSDRYQYVNKDGDIADGLEQPSKEKGDKILTCPLCSAQHPFGFSAVQDPRVIAPGHA